MTVKIFSYSKCSTCRKAIKWLKEKKIEYELIDIIEEPPSRKNILEAISQLGEVKPLLNTSGKSYREIGASSIKALSQNQIVELLVSDSKLLKRPFLINNQGSILVGFNPLNWENALLNYN